MSILLLSILMLALTSCSSPEEKVKSYLEKGNEFLTEGNIEKAKVEFKNALQIKKTSIEAVYGLAQVAEKEGNWQLEYTLLSEVLLKQPKNVQALLKYGNLLLAANEMEKANETAKKLSELAKDDPEAMTFLSALALKNNDAAKSIEYATNALNKNPKLIDAYIILASERAMAKDYPKAHEFLDKALTIEKANVAVQMMKIRMYESTNELDKVENNYQTIIKDHPETPGFRKMFATFLLKNDRKAEAETQLKKLAELEPANLNAKLDLVRFVNQTKGGQAAKATLEEYVKNNPDNFDLKFALFNLYETLKESAASEKLLLDIIDSQRNEPNGLKAKGLLAVRYLKSNKKEEAIKLIDEVIEKDQRNEQALTLKAGLEIDNKEYDNAVAHLRSILRDNPNSVRTLLMLAKLHSITGDKALAEEHYVRALKASNNDVEIGVEYANYFVRNKEIDRAEKVLQDLLDAHKNDLKLLRLMAQVKIARGDYVGAQAIADQLKASSSSAQISEQISGAVQYGQKNYAEGIAAFKRAYEAAPNDKATLVDLIAAYMIAGKTEEAKTLLKAKVEAEPTNYEAGLLLAQVYQRSGAKAEAVSTYKSLLVKFPKAATLSRELSILHMQAGQLPEAQSVVSAGLVENPEDFGLNMVQAGIYESSKKFEEAIKTYEAILKKRPDAEVVNNNLASLLSDTKTDKASYERAYALAKNLKDADSPYFKDTYGWAAYKVGKYDEALSALKEVVTTLGDIPIFQYHLGMVELAKGDKTSAKSSLQKAIQLAKGQPAGIPEDEIKKTLSTL